MDSGFYLRSPFRSRQFVMSLAVLVLLCALAIRMVILRWAHFSALTIGLLLVALCCMILFLCMVVRIHRMMRRLLADRHAEPLEKGSSLAAAVGMLADFSNKGLFLSFVAVFALLFAMMLILGFKRG